MMKTPNISTPIIYSQLKPSTKQKMLCLLFLPTENKRQIQLSPVTIVPSSPMPAQVFQLMSEDHRGEKCRKTTVKNESLGLVKKWRGFCWGKFFSRKLNDAISNLKKISVSRAMFIAQSFIYFEVLTFWAGHRCTRASLCPEPGQNCLGTALTAVQHGKPVLVREASPCRSIRSWSVSDQESGITAAFLYQNCFDSDLYCS